MIFPCQHIEINPKVMLGKPVIKGTHVTVVQVLDILAKSNCLNDVLVAHPHLTINQIRAAVAFAAKSL